MEKASDVCFEYFITVEEKKKQQKKLLTEWAFALEGQKVLVVFLLSALFLPYVKEI